MKAAALILAGAIMGSLKFATEIGPKKIEIAIPVAVKAPVVSFEDALEKGCIAKKIPLRLCYAIAKRESGMRMSAVRFEARQVDKGRAAAVKMGLRGATDFDEQVRNFASSHCALQVMGYHAAARGKSWTALHDPEVCVDIGLTYLKDTCYARQRGNELQRWSKALECYNGSPVYSKEILNEVGGKLLREFLENETA